MSVRELKNLQSTLQSPEFAETSERGRRAAAREQTQGRTEPNMEQAKLPTVKPKGKSVIKSFGFENRETFVIKQKATKEEIAKHASISLIKYLLDIQSNRPADVKEYEKTFLRDCLPHMEAIERYIQMYITDFETICKDNIDLKANKSSDDATKLIENTKNLNARVKQFRNSDIQRLIEELVKNSNKMEDTQISEGDTPSSWIIKRKIHIFHDENNKILDQILFQNQVISKGAQEIYTRITTPTEGLFFQTIGQQQTKSFDIEFDEERLGDVE